MCYFFFFNDTATTEIYTLSLHDALPISRSAQLPQSRLKPEPGWRHPERSERSEEHTSELQSPCNLVCRLLLEKKKIKTTFTAPTRHSRSHLTTLHRPQYTITTTTCLPIR